MIGIDKNDGEHYLLVVGSRHGHYRAVRREMLLGGLEIVMVESNVSAPERFECNSIAVGGALGAMEK